jgi:hypothetical protein
MNPATPARHCRQPPPRVFGWRHQENAVTVRGLHHVQNIDDNTECLNGGGNGADCNIYNSKTDISNGARPATSA